jgi:hypothetical protein
MWRSARSGYSNWLRAEFESRYGQEFPLLHVVQTGSGAHQVPYQMDIVGGGGVSPGIKRQRRKGDHSLPTSAEVKLVELYLHFSIRLHDVALN